MARGPRQYINTAGEMSEPLAEVWESVRLAVVKTSEAWNFHRDLFSDPKHCELMDDSRLKGSFALICSSLVTTIVMRIGRILDSPNFGKQKKNLSFERLLLET